MKKILLFCLAWWLCLGAAEAKKIKGYYITGTGDTIRVTFQIPMNALDGEPSYFKLQWEVIFLDVKNDEWVLKPGEAKEIVFDYGEEHIRMLTRENTIGLYTSVLSPDRYMFLRLLKDGRMKLFQYYYREIISTMVTNSPMLTTQGFYHNGELRKKDILQKNEGKLFPAGDRWYNREEMADYLSDCPKLAQKVKDKIYKRSMIETIVDEYNWTCP